MAKYDNSFRGFGKVVQVRRTEPKRILAAPSVEAATIAARPQRPSTLPLQRAANEALREYQGAPEPTALDNITLGEQQRGALRDRMMSTAKVLKDARGQQPQRGGIVPNGYNPERIKLQQQADAVDGYLKSLAPEYRKSAYEGMKKRAETDPGYAKTLTMSREFQQLDVGGSIGVLPASTEEKAQAEVTAQQEMYKWKDNYDQQAEAARRTGKVNEVRTIRQQQVRQLDAAGLGIPPAQVAKIDLIRRSMDKGQIFPEDAWKQIEPILTAYTKDEVSPAQRVKIQGQRQQEVDARRQQENTRSEWFKGKERQYKIAESRFNRITRRRDNIERQIDRLSAKDDPTEQQKQRIAQLEAQLPAIDAEMAKHDAAMQGLEGELAAGPDAQAQPTAATQPAAGNAAPVAAGATAPVDRVAGVVSMAGNEQQKQAAIEAMAAQTPEEKAAATKNLAASGASPEMVKALDGGATSQPVTQPTTTPADDNDEDLVAAATKKAQERKATKANVLQSLAGVANGVQTKYGQPRQPQATEALDKLNVILTDINAGAVSPGTPWNSVDGGGAGNLPGKVQLWWSQNSETFYKPEREALWAALNQAGLLD